MGSDGVTVIVFHEQTRPCCFGRGGLFFYWGQQNINVLWGLLGALQWMGGKMEPDAEMFVLTTAMTEREAENWKD